MQVCSLHRHIRKRSVNVLALPKDTHTHTHTGAVSWTLKSVKVQFLCFLYVDFKNVQETDPTEMHVLLYGIQSSGPDPFKLRKLDPHTYILYRRTLMMLFPFVLVGCFLFLTLHYAWGPQISTFCFDLMLFTWISCIGMTLLLVWGTTKSQWR